MINRKVEARKAGRVQCFVDDANQCGLYSKSDRKPIEAF